jgi:hypothetical protein
MPLEAPLYPCPGCGALTPESDGPTHPYIGASPGCWAIFSEVLAREYADPRYLSIHRLTTDAYAVQHPGIPSRQSIQSVAVHHLIGLYYVLERGYNFEGATQALRQGLRRRAAFTWLEPPAYPQGLTILEVHQAQGFDEHTQAVQRWAQSVWQAWSAYHEVVRGWAKPTSNHSSKSPRTA